MPSCGSRLNTVDPREGPQRLIVMNRLSRRQRVVWPRGHRTRLLALVGSCILVMSLVLAACGSATSARSVPHGFIGYNWRVVAITLDGKVTSIPARLQVALRFSRGGQFGADDSVNFHSGTYRTTSDGFRISGVMTSTLVGYAGHDTAVLMAISAIGSFDDGARATVKLTADRLVVGVGSYTLACQRRGPGNRDLG